MKFNYKDIIPKNYLIPTKLLMNLLENIEITIQKRATGRPRNDDEAILAGIYYLLKTGCQWEALPKCFGNAKTIYHRFKEFIKANIFQKTWKQLLGKYDAEKGLMLEHQSIDSSHKKSPLGGQATGKSPVDRRKRGTKINMIVEGNGLPIALSVHGGNCNDQLLLIPILTKLQNQITQSKNLYFHTDKGYLSVKNKAALVALNYVPVMPKKKKKNKPRETSKKDTNRWVVERTFSWFGRFRRIFTRYEKLKITFLSFLEFSASIIVFNKI